MNFEFTPGQEAFRQEVRGVDSEQPSYLRTNRPQKEEADTFFAGKEALSALKPPQPKNADVCSLRYFHSGPSGRHNRCQRFRQCQRAAGDFRDNPADRRRFAIRLAPYRRLRREFNRGESMRP
jgi:hypothetical protein